MRKARQDFIIRDGGGGMQSANGNSGGLGGHARGRRKDCVADGQARGV
jgi:hypothetical protein